MPDRTARATPAPTRRGRSGGDRRSQADRSAESREKIISAAIDLVGTNGYNRTTLVEIGQRAGLSRGLVTFHFGSKEQCMVEVIAAIRERVTAQMASGGPHARGLAAIDDLIEQYFLPDRLAGLDGPNYARAMFVLQVEAFTSSPGLRSAVAQNNTLIREMVISWIDQAVADGEIEPTDRAADLAVIVEGTLRGVALQHLTDDGLDLRHIADVTKQLVRGYLSGHLGS
ncbi:TetR/AcrR family transcriptional regulator [Williamsia sp. CHRR-6]|uniref:TetR/AcrR family transcriptional regulator n=1 Tax=Williamsia sp. CHRR-6 TaxID=2835871 RepID=UPI001BDB5E95|nr:TetR/AcrR family transcriptional regulator [Williamsia sp. CHRR-6]MBT0566840.1 TetR/AcrR family transcriptional regulator [Williamsia sp. CHRR-6]